MPDPILPRSGGRLLIQGVSMEFAGTGFHEEPSGCLGIGLLGLARRFCQFLEKSVYRFCTVSQSPLLNQAIEPNQIGLAQLNAQPDIGIITGRIGAHRLAAGGW